MSLRTSLQSSESSSPTDRSGAAGFWLPPGGVTALFLVWLLSRWAFDAMRELVPDEAYYWTWSRHLGASYFDHPPVVAYLIRLGTFLLGNTELGVRCMSGIITAGTVLVLALAARRLVGGFRAASFVPIALLLSPMITVIGSITTPDTPVSFFQAAALAVALAIFAPNSTGSRHIGKWLALGALMGLALDSKYTAILLAAAIFLAMLCASEGRRHLLTPWPWLAVLVAAAVFSPVLYWNAQHHWASFRFQIWHGIGSSKGSALRNIGDYVGGQILVCTPVLFAVCIAALVIYWRRKNNPMHIRILLFSATVPLIFFACSALHRRVEANWPLFAYLPAVVLFSLYLAEHWGKRRVAWAKIAIIVALFCNIVIHCPETVWKLSSKFDSPQWDNLFGWRELAVKQVQPLRFDSPIFAADYHYAAELSFYLPNQPVVRSLPNPSHLTEFDFSGDQTPPQSYPRVVLVRRLPKGYAAPPSWTPLGSGFDVILIEDPSQYRYGRQIRRSQIEIAIRKK